MNFDKKKIKSFLKYSITLVIFAYIAYSLSKPEQWNAIKNSLKEMDPIYFIYLYGVFMIYLLFASLRMLLFARKFGLKKITFKKWFQIFVLSRFLNKFLPQGGNIYRAMILKKEYKLSYKEYTQSFIGFTWIDVQVNLIWIALFTLRSNLDIQILGLSPSICAILAFLATLIIPIILYQLIQSLKIQNKLFQKLMHSYRVTMHIIKDPVFLLKAFMYSSLSFLTYLWMLDLSFSSMQIELHLVQIAVFAAILKSGSYLIITPGNIGITELACGYLGETSNIPFSVGVLAASILRAVSYLVVITLGPSFGGIPLLKEIRKKMFDD